MSMFRSRYLSACAYLVAVALFGTSGQCGSGDLGLFTFKIHHHETHSKNSFDYREIPSNRKTTTASSTNELNITIYNTNKTSTKPQDGADALQEDCAQVDRIINKLCRHASLPSTPSNGPYEDTKSSQNSNTEEFYQEGENGYHIGSETSIDR